MLCYEIEVLRPLGAGCCVIFSLSVVTEKFHSVSLLLRASLQITVELTPSVSACPNCLTGNKAGSQRLVCHQSVIAEDKLISRNECH